MRAESAGAFVAVGANGLGGLGLDQGLQTGPDQLGEHRTVITRLQRVELGEQGRWSWGIASLCPFCELLWSPTH